MMERRHWNKSWLLSKILDHAVLGTQEALDIRRRNVLISDYLCPPHIQTFVTGSVGEGFQKGDSDTDVMTTILEVAVLYSETYPDVAENFLEKTVFFLREANCQPGYVILELAHLGKNTDKDILAACVPFRSSIYISSDIFRQQRVDDCRQLYGIPFQSNGPCTSITTKHIGVRDFSFAFSCLNWPHEALSWINRTRLYGWPPRTLINKIVQDGCHVVPVGDKCSEDTFLQWRLSFAKAERYLVYSLNHLQMKVYSLMKHLLKQIRGMLRSLIKEDDILCSYFVKTIIFYAVENSPPPMWQESHIFTCFQFCLSILIDWVKSAYCPHYFIPQNNLFLRKVCGQNQRKLLQVLLEVKGMKWRCLLDMPSTGSGSIGDILQSLIGEETRYLNYIYPSVEYLEFLKDRSLFTSITFAQIPSFVQTTPINKITVAVMKSQTDMDEYVFYRCLLEYLVKVARYTYARNTTSGGNKKTYKDLKKCKHLLAPLASFCRSPGKLYLATFHYLVGNYSQVLDLCKVMTSSSTLLFENLFHIKDAQNYINTFCGKGYSWYQKCDGFAYTVFIGKEFCPHELLLEAKRSALLPLFIPPVPYALFLTFLSNYHLGNTRKCRQSLLYLMRVSVDNKYFANPGFWIIHSLLGICFQYAGEYRMAIKAFDTSLKSGPVNNPAKERIAVTCLLLCYQNLKSS